jgi:hypothetical protein
MAAVATCAPAWVIVERPGADDETVVCEYASQLEARRAFRDMQDDGAEVDLMKRESDGTLTTEF